MKCGKCKRRYDVGGEFCSVACKEAAFRDLEGWLIPLFLFGAVLAYLIGMLVS
jgi:hypothetical protein